MNEQKYFVSVRFDEKKFALRRDIHSKEQTYRSAGVKIGLPVRKLNVAISQLRDWFDRSFGRF